MRLLIRIEIVQNSNKDARPRRPSWFFIAEFEHRAIAAPKCLHLGTRHFVERFYFKRSNYGLYPKDNFSYSPL